MSLRELLKDKLQEEKLLVLPKGFEISHFKRVLEELGWHIDFYRDCGGVAPRVSRYIFDLKEQ
jgi:hypothetical protein